MKKLLAMLLVLVMALSMVACGSGKTEEPKAPAATTPVTNNDTKTEEPAAEEPAEEVPAAEEAPAENTE